MTSIPTTLRRTSMAALALIAVAVPAAHAVGRPAYPQNNDIWATGVAPGQTEHGVFTTSDANDPHWPYFRRVEYWATSDRWTARASDRAGRLLDASVGGPEGFTTYTAARVDGVDGTHIRASVRASAKHQLPPFPGYGSLYNPQLVTARVYVALSPPQQRTIAGFTGTVYTLNFGGPHARTRETVVLQDGTFQPLMREDFTPRTGHPAIDVQERLRSRVTVPSASASVQLTHATYTTTVAGWRATVKAATARGNHSTAKTTSGGPRPAPTTVAAKKPSGY